MTACNDYQRGPVAGFSVSIPMDSTAEMKLSRELELLAAEASLLADTSSLLANSEVAISEAAELLGCLDCDLFVADMCYEGPNMMFPEDVYEPRVEAAAPNLNP